MTKQPFTSDPALRLLDDTEDAADVCCVLPPSLRLSSAEAEELSAMFKALGHPVRLQIVDLLSRFAGQVCVCDVENQFELSQPTISHHLKILREAGLVAAEQRGLWVFYYLRPAAVDKLRSLLDGVR
jgi:ArsR family transcriptional regulator, arsenate/arsenite/antimonite-responsive transcriptional repressor